MIDHTLPIPEHSQAAAFGGAPRSFSNCRGPRRVSPRGQNFAEIPGTSPKFSGLRRGFRKRCTPLPEASPKSKNFGEVPGTSAKVCPLGLTLLGPLQTSKAQTDGRSKKAWTSEVLQGQLESASKRRRPVQHDGHMELLTHTQDSQRKAKQRVVQHNIISLLTEIGMCFAPQGLDKERRAEPSRLRSETSMDQELAPGEQKTPHITPDLILTTQNSIM